MLFFRIVVKMEVESEYIKEKIEEFRKAKCEICKGKAQEYCPTCGKYFCNNHYQSTKKHPCFVT